MKLNERCTVFGYKTNTLSFHVFFASYAIYNIFRKGGGVVSIQIVALASYIHIHNVMGTGNKIRQHLYSLKL